MCTFGKCNFLFQFQLLYEEVLSHSTLLDTITAKSDSISENFVTQLELQDLQERYNTIKDSTMVTTTKWCQNSQFYTKCYYLMTHYLMTHLRKTT